ncbi:MAG: hypothetical protein ACRET0_16800, partial [Steroidobacteraceae bacterium]
MTSGPAQAHQTAGKLAQLLGEVLIHHAPHTARISSEATVAATNEWLEGLEAHTSKLIGPVLQGLLDNSDPPAEIRALLQEAISPSAQFGATLQQIFLWGIVSNIIGSSLQPFLVAVTNQLNTSAVSAGIAVPVDASTIATAAGRGLNLGDPPTVTVPDWAYTEAAKQGMSHEDIDLQASLIGLPPALQELFELYRRGDIQLDDVRQGLREGDFRDDWIERTLGLAHAWLTPLDFVRAAVQAQLPYSDAQQWANKTGLDTSTDVPLDTAGTEATADMFGLAFSIAGRPPGPQELARMALRGIIPWQGTGAGQTTFQQGIAESDVKTKWTDALQALSVYVPPPRMVGTLLERGAITAAQAQQLWEQDGVPAALAAGYVYEAQQQHIGQDKLLALGEIKTGYYDGILSHDQAIGLLGDLGQTGEVATEILAIVDFRREIQSINAVVHHIESAYGARRLDATNAKAALEQVGIDSAQADQLLRTWEALRVAPLRVPSASEIGIAYKHGTITQPEALSELAALGYQPRDAVIVLSAHATALVAPL